MSHRSAKVGAQIQREITGLLQLGKLKDPRIADLTTITGVDVSRDLASAKVFFTVLGQDDVIETTRSGLTAAAGFIQRHLAKALHTRVVPQVTFEYDPSVAAGDRMNRLLASLPEFSEHGAETPDPGENSED